MTQALLLEIRDTLTRAASIDAGCQAVLDRVLAHMECVVGTIHSWDDAGRMLRLRAERGLPGRVRDVVQQIPMGKGMAGLAAERRQPVQVCNLQSDCSGMAQPMARETRMEGSIAVPMLVEDRLRGVLGVARPVAHEFSAGETALLLQIGALIGAVLE